MADERIQMAAITDFRGGVNLDTALDALEANELVEALNSELSERGAIRKRAGWAKFNASSYDSIVTQIFEWPRKDETTQLMAVMGDTLYEVAENGARTAVQTSTSSEIGHFFFQDRLYWVDGAEYYVYDGSSSDPVTPKDEPDNNLGPIRRCRFAVRHPKSFRFFAAGDPQEASAVYFSEPNEPDYWKDTSILHPSTDDGPVVGLSLLGDAVLVWFRHSLWVWRGVDPTLDVVWEKLAAPEGTVSHRTIALTPQSTTFLGEGGLFAMSPQILGLTGEQEPGQDVFRNLAEGKFTSLLERIVQKEQTRGVYDGKNRRYLLSYTESDNPAHANDTVLVLDWPIGAITFWRAPGVGVRSWCYRHNGDLLAGMDNFILRLNEGTVDAHPEDSDQAINFDVRTPPVNVAPFQRKRFLRVGVTFKYEDEMELLLGVYVDGKLVKTIALHDSAEPHEGTEDWRRLVTTRDKVMVNGERIQARIQNTQANMPVEVYGIAFEWLPLWPLGRQV